MLNGYSGKLLRIDLTGKSIAEEKIKEEDIKQFIGGSGLGSKVLFNETDETTDPLGPQNVLIYLTGPFANTPVPTSGRHSIVAKSPLTGIWGEADVGGKWGVWLKSRGYDGIIIRGVSENPAIIYIGDSGVEIRDGAHLWGKDTYETEELLEKELGHEVAISCIGIAGENLVKFANIMHDGRHARAAGRCGLGAVMGSKKLKAIVIKRGKSKVPLNNKARLLEDIKTMLPKMKENRREATLYGTSRYILAAEAIGDLPVKNWQLGNWSEGAEKISGRRMSETILVGNYSCHGCPFACGREVEVSDGPFAPVNGAGYEYETAALLGASCLVDNIKAIAKANELCNRYGLDTISTGSVIAFAMEAFEKGLLPQEEGKSLKLEWGNPVALIGLIELIANRRGIGDVLAEGSKRSSAIIGHDSDKFAIHVKGLELPGHDPRCFNGLGLGYATSNRGACHVDSLVYVYEGGFLEPSLHIVEPYDRLSWDGKGKLVALSQNYMSLCDSLKVCKFICMCVEAKDLCRWLNWITGWNIELEEFLKIGERIFNLKRLYNVRCGISRKDDKLPERIVTLEREGLNAPERLIDLNRMLDEYYMVRGWDKDGIPKKEKLRELNLE